MKYNDLEVYDGKTGAKIPVEALESILREERKNLIRHLEKKFRNKTISKIELEELMKYKYKNTNIKILYNSFFKVNMHKPKPKEINHAEYGKFFEMLNFLSYENSITHRNGKIVKRKDLAEYLGYKNLRGFNSFIRKLSRQSMLGESVIGGINYLFINPAYAQRNMKVNSTIFNLFKKDLLEYLDEYQIAYLEMNDTEIDMDEVIPITQN